MEDSLLDVILAISIAIFLLLFVFSFKEFYEFFLLKRKVKREYESQIIRELIVLFSEKEMQLVKRMLHEKRYALTLPDGIYDSDQSVDEKGKDVLLLSRYLALMELLGIYVECRSLSLSSCRKYFGEPVADLGQNILLFDYIYKNTTQYRELKDLIIRLG